MSTPDQQQLSQVAFRWKFSEYVTYKKNTWWYAASLIILVLMVAWMIKDGNYSFAVFLVLFYVVILIYENRPPETVDFAITIDGVKAGNKFYYYRDISEFFIIYEDFGIKKLYFEFFNPLRGRLSIPLDGQNPVVIRDFLLKYIKEDLEREAEPISEAVGRWLRF